MKRSFSAKNALIAAFATAILLFSSCGGKSTEGIDAVTLDDPSEYMGKWYEIARLPQWFEKDVRNAEAEYTLLDDGSIRIVNSGIRDGKETKSEAVGKVVRAGTGELRVSFFRPFYSPYRIIILDDDCTLAAVTGSTFSSLWILSRMETPDEKLLTEYLEKLRVMGFDVDALEYPSGAQETETQVTDR